VTPFVADTGGSRRAASGAHGHRAIVSPIMTPDECRAARERLNWTRDELRKAADVPLWFIAAFEDGKETPGFLVCWEMAIEAALGDAVC
jgi:hypothetical protein